MGIIKMINLLIAAIAIVILLGSVLVIAKTEEHNEEVEQSHDKLAALLWIVDKEFSRMTYSAVETLTEESIERSIRKILNTGGIRDCNVGVKAIGSTWYWEVEWKSIEMDGVIKPAAPAFRLKHV